MGKGNEAYVEVNGRRLRIREYEGELDIVEFKRVDENTDEIHLLWFEPGKVEKIGKEEFNRLPLLKYPKLFTSWVIEIRNKKLDADSFFEEKLNEYEITGQLREAFLNQLEDSRRRSSRLLLLKEK